MDKVTKIFADGNCIVCDMEISHYKQMAPELFEIVDISHPDFDAQKFNLTPQAVNKNMHILTPDGKLHIGVDAFAHIWDRLGKYNFAAKIIRNPIVNPLAHLAYKAFTIIRPLLPKKNKALS